MRDMDFETEASEPDVMSGIVITKGNGNERGPDDLTRGDWWANGYQNWDEASFKERLRHTTAGFFITLAIFFTLFVCCPSLLTQTNYASRLSIFRSIQTNHRS